MNTSTAEKRILRRQEQALRRAWATLNTREMFTVSSARHLFPKIAAKFSALVERARAKDAAPDRNSKPVKASGDFDCVFAWVPFRNFASQGYGAEKYARCRAYLFGLTVPDQLPWKLVDHPSEDRVEVRVCCDPKDRNEVIGRGLSRSVSIRDAVKACWKLGCQPRVFWPFLDPDFEKKNGLDFYGNDVTVSA